MSEWIKCSEETPENKGEYLIYGDQVIDVGFFRDEIFFPSNYKAWDLEVTHWMPLPNQPEEPSEPVVAPDEPVLAANQACDAQVPSC